jgi:rubrerythrin
MNTCDVLENCIQMERILGEIYELFMRQQASSPEYASLWEKTAQEEHNHEQQFILAKRLACSMKTDAATAQPSDELVKKLAALKARLEVTPLSPGEAIRMAIDLEEKLSAFHMDQMHIFSDKFTNSLFTSMMNNDNGHIEALKKAYESCCNPQPDDD